MVYPSEFLENFNKKKQESNIKDSIKSLMEKNNKPGVENYSDFSKVSLIKKIKKQYSLNDEYFVDIISQIYGVEKVSFESKRFFSNSYETLNDAYKKNYIELEDSERKKYILFNSCIKSYPKTHIALIATKSVFDEILNDVFLENNLINSINYNKETSPKSSAANLKILNSYSKKIFLLAFFILFISQKMFFLFCVNLIYFFQSVLKLILFFASIIKKLTSNFDLPKNKKLKNFPIYTILIPLYKEKESIKNIIKSIDALDYDKRLLDVKLLVEYDDFETISELNNEKLPSYFSILKIPPAEPRTKPKALNYAIPYIRGEYLVIYDAEDLPERDQLKKALLKFSNLDEKYACLQAKLNFYNSQDSMLTRLFSLEYSMWFEYLLKGLSILKFPMTLGGTSNHFKVNILREVGFWDPYNVTEDAELGVRFYLKGYKISMLDSTTYEESTKDIGSWSYQRIRWIKGFYITLMCFLKQVNFNIFNLRNFVIFNFVGSSTMSFLFAPILIFYLKFSSIDNYYMELFCLINLFLNVFFIISSGVIISIFNKTNIRKIINMESRILDFQIFKGLMLEFYTIIIFPFYFLLHSIIAYIAIYELFFKPFKWNKTNHHIDYVLIEKFKKENMT